MSGMTTGRLGVAALVALAACGGNGGGGTTPTVPPVPVDTTTAQVRAFVTTGNRTKFLDSAGVRFTTAAAPELVINVDTSRTYQTMVGFGAAFTDASTWLIQTKMRADQRQGLLNDLFSPTSGLGLSFMRMTMGSSDFSREHWSYDDAPGGADDPSMTHFSIQRDREAMLPVIQQSRAINPQMMLVASPWSAPAWMKTTRSMIKGHLRPEAYPAHANYFIRFLKAYQAEGVTVQALTIQNEPHFEPDNYPGMRMDPPERAAFIGGHLGPALQREGLNTLIWDWDHNWDEPNSPLGTLSDATARGYIDGVAWHCYGGDVSAQSTVRNAHPDKDVFFTECSGGQWATNFGENLVYFSRTLIVGTTRNWARGVAFWNLALDPQGGPHLGGCGNCRGVVTIDPVSGGYVRNEEYFALAHASRFVRPGAVRVESGSGLSGMESAAFVNPDGRKALLVVNTTTQERTYGVRQGGRMFTHTLPAQSVATFTWR
ncbi:glucosylceramidase [Longimicrobium terrae]|uniref:Glucosylceramidase n=2 Tax=Longimicrobium terrae TaxID=1639882 RepID=A0A841H715_9BACT|nr:glucosylceramidase [Longimicrobium terrae]MBB6073897.1 glucosylceramidase [Longimicrobium terrae]